MNYLIALACFLVGFCLVKYSKWIVDTTSIRFAFFENSWGPGASYSIWKLAGVIVIGAGFYFLFN